MFQVVVCFVCLFVVTFVCCCHVCVRWLRFVVFLGFRVVSLNWTSVGQQRGNSKRNGTKKRTLGQSIVRSPLNTKTSSEIQLSVAPNGHKPVPLLLIPCQVRDTFWKLSFFVYVLFRANTLVFAVESVRLAQPHPNHGPRIVTLPKRHRYSLLLRRHCVDELPRNY